jgi:hypothetical protein
MALDKSKYDNVIQISEWVLCTLIAEHHGVAVDDVTLSASDHLPMFIDVTI